MRSQGGNSIVIARQWQYPYDEGVRSKEGVMADRRVRQTGKDSKGDITSLCNAGEPWSPRLKAGAISDIETGAHTYYVQESGSRTDVKVVQGPTGKYLRTDADPTSANNLDNLPN